MERVLTRTRIALIAIVVCTLGQTTVSGKTQFEGSRTFGFDGHYEMRNAFPADMDGDGAVDIIYVKGGTEYDLVWAKNSGTDEPFNASSPVTAIVSSDKNIRPQGAADVDLDGSVDVITVGGRGASDSQLRVFRSGSEEVYDCRSSCYEAFVANITNDEYPDLLVLSYDTSSQNIFIEWMENDGTGRFESHREISKTFQTTGVGRAHIKKYGVHTQMVDLTGDGYDDLVVRYLYGARITSVVGKAETWLYENDSGKGFLPPVLTLPESCETTSLTDNAHAFVIDDFTGDGSLDFVTMDGSSTCKEVPAFHRVIELTTQTGDGYETSRIYDEYGVWDMPASVISSDLDLDGDMDIVGLRGDNIGAGGSGDNPRAVYWFENDGTGKFTPGGKVGGYTLATEWHHVDLDNDQLLDMMYDMMYGTSDEWVWHKNVKLEDPVVTNAPTDDPSNPDVNDGDGEGGSTGTASATATTTNVVLQALLLSFGVATYN